MSVWHDLFAQKSLQDSVANMLDSQTADSSKVSWLFQRGRTNWFRRNLPEADYFLRQAIVVSEQSQQNQVVADAYNLLANVYLKLQQYDSVFHFLNKALAQGDENFLPLIQSTFSKVYEQLGDYPISLQYALNAADNLRQNPDPQFNLQVVYAYTMAGELLEKMGRAESAFDYYLKAYEVGRTAQVNWYIKEPILKMAQYYLQNKELEKARHLYDTILSIDTTSPSHEPTMHAFVGLGKIAMAEQYYKDAVDFYRKAIAYASQKDLLINIENFHADLGAAFLSAKQYDSAEVYLLKAIDRSLENKNHSNLSKAYMYLSKLKEMQGNYPQAIVTFQLHKNYQDSVLNFENARAVSNLEVLYQTRQKENEILRLKEVEREKDFAIKKRNTYIFIAMAGLLVLMIIIFLLRNNLKHRQHLHEQKIKQMEQQQQVVSLQSMINGQEAERTRVAKDLHDGLGGLFSTIKMYFSTLQYEEPALADKELFQKTYSSIDNAAEEVRRIAHNMMPEVLVKMGLINALHDLCANISAGKLLHVSMEVHGMHKRLNATTEIMLFRIIQELLNNIIKHAQASEVIIQFIKEDNRLSVIVEDNGRGFNSEEVDKNKHAGIETVQSRVAYLNGKLSIDSQMGVGTTVMMDFLINE
ncbi:MAG TPA: histidine kinase [Cyclobacteriaceae bacterium]|nr:histidine kinase [Cyclobacteriaceae bacterium]